MQIEAIDQTGKMLAGNSINWPNGVVERLFRARGKKTNKKKGCNDKRNPKVGSETWLRVLGVVANKSYTEQSMISCQKAGSFREGCTIIYP